MALSEHELLEAAVGVGLLSTEDLSDARALSRRERMPIGQAVARQIRQPMTALYQAVAQRRRIPYLHPSQMTPTKRDLERLPKGLVTRRQCLPVRQPDGTLLLAMANPDDLSSIEQVSKSLDENLQPCLAFPEALAGVIERFMGEGAADHLTAENATDLLSDILSDAFIEGASDVHLQPVDRFLRVRYRVDGRLRDWRRDLRPSEREPLINRIKVLSNLDIAESRAPQDGSFRYSFPQFEESVVEVRTSTLPVQGGERVVMRLLGGDAGITRLVDIGMNTDVQSAFAKAIDKPHGVVLVTGPTGSGKSTTLYAALREIDRSTRNVITVEDPIEQFIDGTSQVQISTKVGFSDALRSILRQDPDVILVGEIRDGETADIALKAAQTGHLVFSTLHTNTAIGAVTRLTDLGVGRWQVAASLNGVISQRLVPKLCENCKTPRKATAAENKALKRPADCCDPVFDAGSCPFCLGSGYSGRMGVFESVWIDDALRDRISQGASEADMIRVAANYVPLETDLIKKVVSGLTSVAAAMALGFEVNNSADEAEI